MAYVIYRAIVAVGVVGLAIPGVNRRFGARFVDISALNLAEAIPPPPREAAEVAADLDGVRKARAAADATTIEALRADSERSIGRFYEVLGMGFDMAQVRSIARLASLLTWHEKMLLGPVKARHARPRPYQFDPAIAPLVARPFSPSYPSGHATIAGLWAAALGVIVPEHARALTDRADIYARHRIAAGVHFPTDVAAGLDAARLIHAAMLDDDGYRRFLDRARVDIERAREVALNRTAPGRD